MDEQTVSHHLADALAETLFRQPGPVPLRDLLEALPQGMTFSPAGALAVLRADPRFAPCATRWDLAHRADLAGRPLGGALQAILSAYGKPMSQALLITELCLGKGGDPEEFRQLLGRLLRGNRDLGTDGEHFYLQRWLPNTAASEPARLLYLNGLDQDQVFIKAQTKLQAASFKGRTPLDTAAAVLKACPTGLDNRALGLMLHKHHGERYDAAETLSAMLADERFRLLSGPRWLHANQIKALEKAAAKLAGAPEARSEPVDLVTLLQAPPAQRLKLTEEVRQAVNQLVTRSRTPLSVAELLEDVMALRPKQRNFAPAAHALEEALHNDLRLLRLDRGYYLPRTAVPEWVRTVPPLLLPETVPAGPRELSPDVLLPVEMLAPELAEKVQSPEYEDQGETEVRVGAESAGFTQIPVLYHHHRLGTAKLRIMDRRVLHVPGPIAVVTCELPAGGTIPLWINIETRLLHGLLEWYDNYLPPCGGLITLRRLDEVGLRFRLEYQGETDPGTHIGRDRFIQLLELRDRLRGRPVYLVDLLTDLFHLTARGAGRGDKGLVFDQLWAQVNVLRRTTRQQVASILEHYNQFQPASGGKWNLAK